MREDEFEKRVREKMEHLGFDPSESVWTGVDKEINKEKKRRMPLFWLFFVSGLLLAGGAYYFITNKNSSGIIPDKNTGNTIARIPEKKLAIKSRPTTALQSAEASKNNSDRKRLKRSRRQHAAGTVIEKSNQLAEPQSQPDKNLVNRRANQTTNGTQIRKKTAQTDSRKRKKQMKPDRHRGGRNSGYCNK